MTRHGITTMVLIIFILGMLVAFGFMYEQRSRPVPPASAAAAYLTGEGYNDLDRGQAPVEASRIRFTVRVSWDKGIRDCLDCIHESVGPTKEPAESDRLFTMCLDRRWKKLTGEMDEGEHRPRSR